MRRAASHLGWSGLALLGALAGAAACADQAVIVVDVTWTPELAARFGPEDQLRIYAGYPAGSGDFVRSDEAFFEEKVAKFAGRMRYQLTPEAAPGEIGDLQLVAAVAGPGGPRAFGAAPELVRFAAGEVRTVPIALAARSFDVNGDGARCLAWDVATDGRDGTALGELDNLDCDSFLDGDDCAPFVASDPGDPEICDGVDQACDGALLIALPCNAAPAGFALGTRACDEQQARDWLGCAPDGPVPNPPLPPPEVVQRIRTLDDPAAGCLHAPDPLACAGGAAASDDGFCRSDAALGTCDDYASVRAAVGPMPALCKLRIVGGTLHGEWEVGFVESRDPAAESHGVATSCDTLVRLRARAPKLVPRTVLIEEAIGDGTLPRFRFVRLEPGDGGACDGPTCEGVLEP